MQLFLGFLHVGVLGFGGVLPWARTMIVDQRQWLTQTEFTEMLGLCQFLPGGNVMNLTVALGARFRGVPGAVASTVGLLAAPVAIVIMLGAIYEQYADIPAVKRGFVAMTAAACGYLLATSLKIVAPLRADPWAIAVAVATFIAVAVLRIPLLLALPVMAIGSSVLLARMQP
ncbi:chromate transporter [Rhodopila sp.]|jgi:chromate transporter|uniref:chromate transporter n=1 Tax=Rhodopila sp. TaxID=2480087 RepID=UPI002BC493ED|nr:chromate transporter [Rhodopila sp.]HVZ06996.1 chromate transporter [Rhodopila sp.]